jgi:hypothetical protein
VNNKPEIKTPPKGHIKGSLGHITTYGKGLHEDVTVDGVPHKIIPAARLVELESQVTRLQSAVKFYVDRRDDEQYLLLEPNDLDPVGE